MIVNYIIQCNMNVDSTKTTIQSLNVRMKSISAERVTLASRQRKFQLSVAKLQRYSPC